MSTRKPKSSLPYLTDDLPTRRLQLITVDAKPRKAAARPALWTDEESALPERALLPPKTRLH